MSEVQDRVKVLLEWCAANSIFIDSQIRVGSNSQAGIGVFSEDCFIPPQTTRALVRIRKDSVLSVRTCSLAGVIPSNPYGLAAQLSLSLALHVEILKGRQSRWHGYLQSLPVGVMDLPLFWDLHTDANENEDGSGALTWLRGTEARKIIFGRTENGATKLEEVTCFYYDVAKPLLLHYTEVWRQDASTRMPTLLDFYRAFSLVSSRAFLVDAYHGLSMVPIADAYVMNHRINVYRD
ncbi:hypothetical protein BDZ97DRAFT_1365609 [Flammula alnicola]|nr:hypothetical protein BDZ97DRAFT_1365609 [Flammula alnicola]